MNVVFYWIGVAHVAAYAVLGAFLVYEAGFNFFVKRAGIAADLLRIYGIYLKEKRKPTPSKEEGRS